MFEKLLTLKEVSEILRIPESDIEKFVSEGKIPAYKIGGKLLRFKRDQIEHLKKDIENFKSKKILKGNLSKLYEMSSKGILMRPEYKKKANYSIIEKVKDFFYYYDFYIFVSILIAAIIILIIYNF